MNASHTAPHTYSRPATPWPIRIILIVSILFGIWVDASTADSNSNGQVAADPTQTALLGLNDEHSVATHIVRTLAARR